MSDPGSATQHNPGPPPGETDRWHKLQAASSPSPRVPFLWFSSVHRDGPRPGGEACGRQDACTCLRTDLTHLVHPCCPGKSSRGGRLAYAGRQQNARWGQARPASLLFRGGRAGLHIFHPFRFLRYAAAPSCPEEGGLVGFSRCSLRPSALSRGKGGRERESLPAFAPVPTAPGRVVVAPGAGA